MTTDPRPLSAEEEALIRQRIERLNQAQLPLGAGDILDARFLDALDAERARHEALVAAAGDYLAALDADLHREGTPEDGWRRSDTLEALRAALREDTDE